MVVLADADKKTLPQAESGNKTENPKDDVQTTLSGDDRHVRLGNIALTWGVIQHFYPYFDLVDVDWDAELTKALVSASTDPDGKAFANTLERMTAPLNDGHSSVFAEDLRDMAYLPIRFASINGGLYVKHAFGAAEGIPPGSSVLEIDNEPIEQFIATFKQRTSAATQSGMGDKLAKDSLAGKKGSLVQLRYRKPDGEIGETGLARDINMMDYYVNFVFAGRPSPISEIRPGIWYVDTSRFDADVFESVLPALASANGVIFDYREYVSRIHYTYLGHLHDDYMLSPRWGTPSVTEPDRNNWHWQMGRHGYAPRSPHIACRKIFLAGGGTISAGETELGVIEAYGLGEIIGEQSAGTNGGANNIVLPGAIPLFGRARES